MKKSPGHLVVLFIVFSLAGAYADSGPVTVDPDIHAPDRLLVQLVEPIGHRFADDSYPLQTGLGKIDALVREAGVQRIEHALPVATRSPRDPEALARYGLDRTYEFIVPAGTDIVALAARFSELPEVAVAVPEYYAVPGDLIPNDPSFDDQWGLHNTGQTGGTLDCDVDAPAAWDRATGDGVPIAVVDSGIDLDHPDLAANLWTNPGEIPGNGIDDDANGFIDDVHGWDFLDDDSVPDDVDGHGTRTASIVSAVTDNGVGIAGTCWNCDLLTIKTFGGGGTSGFADGVVWAVDHGARVINLSGYYGWSHDPIQLGAVSYAYDAGAVFVDITYNNNVNDIPSPGMYVETITVGATDHDDRRWNDGSFGSNYGPEIDVVAPGVEILCSALGGGTQYATGTSRSAPLLSGLIGTMATIHPSLGREEIRHLIQSGADDQRGDPTEDTPGFDIYHGWGRVNMESTLAATEAAASLRLDGATATRPYLATPNPLADSYDFVRADLASLSESATGVDLGNVVCLENDSPDADTTGNEDTATPLPGEGFVYLARFNSAPGAGSYGGSSRNRDRVTFHHPGWVADSDVAAARFGYAVESAGDVNCDGYDDVIVGAPYYTDGQTNEGAAFVYHGSASGLSPSPNWSVQGNQTGAQYGWSVAGAADVNNDGCDDVLVGARLYDAGHTDEGRAYLYLGSPLGLATTPIWTDESDQAGAQYGYRVAFAGDVNNDTLDDVVVGAYLFDGALQDEGRVYLYFGTGSGLNATPDWTGDGGQAHARLGLGLAGSVDINNDGYADVIAGAPLYDNGQTNEGRLFIYLGTPTGLSSADTREINVADSRFARTVGAAGDVNDDGFDDVIVGATTYSAGVSSQGAAFVYHGSPSGLASAYTWVHKGGQAGAGLGRSVGPAGDLNGDNYADVVVGAPGFDVTRTDEGRALMFFGSASGLSMQPGWSTGSHQPEAALGYSAAAAGDVNGDGRDDLIAGAYLYDDGELNEGRVLVFHGPLEEPAAGDCPR